MAKRGVRKKEEERLDDPTIRRVIQLLGDEKEPITKKAACEILNISYNTKRLNSIIEEYKAQQEFIKKRYKQNRGKPISDMDKQYIITSYLKGDNITQISRAVYRNVDKVKRFIEECGLPSNKGRGDYFNPELIPDKSLKEEYSVGDMVWSARYNAVAEITGKLKDNIYRLWVYGRHNESAYQPWYELADISFIEKLGISNDDLKTHSELKLTFEIK
jgi:hypothetical protein